MATAKLIFENERTKQEKMNESESATLPIEERQKGGIYECVSKYPTNIDYLKMILDRGTEDVNFRGEHGRTALHEAVRKDAVESVKLLMSAGASLEFRDVDENTALHYAYLDAKPEENAGEIFKILFPRGKNAESIRISKTRKLSEIQKCRCHLRTFEQTWFDAATSTNKNGDNILELVLKGDNLNETKREIVQYLIKETEIFYLLKLLRNTQRNSTVEVGIPFESTDNFSINSPFRRLLELYPEIISDLMDRCIVKDTGKVHYHFELLDDTYLLHTWPPQQEYYCKWLYESKWEHIHAKEKKSREVYTKKLSKISNNHPLMLMLKHNRDNTSKGPGKRDVYRQLVDHPLVKALIEHKWLHIGRKFHIFSLIIYMVFLCSLTTFLIVIDTLYVRFQDSENISTTSNKTGCINSTVCTSTYICSYSKDCNNTTPCYSTSSYNVTTTPTTQDLVTCETYGSDPMITVLQILVIFLGIILAIKEIYHIVMTYGWEYFKQVKNCIKLTTYATSLLFVINLSECKDTAYRETWQWVLGTVAIFLAWVNLLAYVEKFDWLGIYVSMLNKITKTFLCKILPIVAILLVAFALAFLCARKKEDKFKGFLVSLLSTSSMMADGFDYEIISKDRNTFLVFISHLTSSTFLIIMTIIIMNLMVGVAIRNVEAVHMHAMEAHSTLQIEHSLELEHIFQVFITFLMRFRRTKKFGIQLKVKFIQQPNKEVLAYTRSLDIGRKRYSKIEYYESKPEWHTSAPEYVAEQIRPLDIERKRYSNMDNHESKPEWHPTAPYNIARNRFDMNTHKLNDWECFNRFIYLGSELSYNPHNKYPYRKKAECIDRLIGAGKGVEVVKQLSTISKYGRSWRQNYLIFALAICARSNDKETKKEAYKELSAICHLPTHLFLFVNYCKQESLRSGSKGWGRAHRRAIIKWYEEKAKYPVVLARFLTKYKSRKMQTTYKYEEGEKYKEEETWSHTDILKNAHPQFKDDFMKVVQKYLYGDFNKAKSFASSMERPNESILKFLNYIEGTEIAKTCTDVKLEALIKEYNLEREHIPTQRPMIPMVCKAIMSNMTAEKKILNINLMASKGLCNEGSECEKEMIAILNDEKFLCFEKIHPIRILITLLSYKLGKQQEKTKTKNARVNSRNVEWNVNQNICRALNEAFYRSFNTVQSSKKRFLIAISGSEHMDTKCTICPTINYKQAAAVMMMLTIRTEEKCKIVGFSDGLKELTIEKNDKLEIVSQKISELKAGETDVSIPVRWALEEKKKFDVFIVYSDNDKTKCHNASEALTEYQKEMEIPEAKLIVVSLLSTDNTIADDQNPFILNIVGFDKNAAVIMQKFANSEI
ncbi:uncharacterized protein LOC132746167 [Ruditapes philippinarum]|uniref:uncharacterized protein LOC132746167 n=1 Tax=Ruditapes philippinarum TaxID=129788 RepID=UPI00295BFC59|nr:uncharacterized protein LOC132746167 [Ruditapes philippinarum]